MTGPFRVIARGDLTPYYLRARYRWRPLKRWRVNAARGAMRRCWHFWRWSVEQRVCNRAHCRACHERRTYVDLDGFTGSPVWVDRKPL